MKGRASATPSYKLPVLQPLHSTPQQDFIYRGK